MARPSGLTAEQRARRREITKVKIAMGVTALVMLMQVVVGYTFNVLSLVAESYHMMNDVAAFVVQLYAKELANVDREWIDGRSAFSYGFGRVEFVANLVQGALLLALCLTLTLESIQRAFSTETLLLPFVTVIAGVVTLIWNIVMFYMFRNKEGGHDLHAHSLSKRLTALSKHACDSQKKEATGLKLFVAQNAMAVHAIGDALGSIAIIIDGAFSWALGPDLHHPRWQGPLMSWSGVGFVDPICALVVIYIILKHTYPLITTSSFALMHAFDPAAVKEISARFRGHDWLPSLSCPMDIMLKDLHIWQLSETSKFATVKLELYSRHEPNWRDFAALARAAKGVLGPTVPPAHSDGHHNLRHLRRVAL
ncbi:hypothetical protein Rhopal_006994-T1 [Rhodotorula paludigena]|uniref:Cation efflux protein transmembrane domain-containing protein n=1 Tax=Rhodotorula paludigena TaxID=86838 RepID=A0AAV5GMX9_9BASI|nr:hypothetical protein Rhopal_006994-T1 [Rhodotorula paludigena]